MIIAAVLDEKENIVPIVDGKILRLYNTNTKESSDFAHPALHLKEGKRGATLHFAEEKGATAFVTPPHTFCELSYAKAKQDDIQFYHLEQPVSFQEFKDLLVAHKLLIRNELPDEEIVPSGIPR